MNITKPTKIGRPSLNPTYIPHVNTARVFEEMDGTSYRVVIKRNDPLFQTLNMLNTILNIIGVLLVFGIFVMVCYGVVTLSEVAHVVSVMKDQQGLG